MGNVFFLFLFWNMFISCYVNTRSIRLGPGATQSGSVRGGRAQQGRRTTGTVTRARGPSRAMIAVSFTLNHHNRLVMKDSNTLLVGLGAAATALGAYKLWQKHSSSAHPLPPSPTSYPLIGHLLSMPTSEEHVGFVEIGKQLNSLFRLQLWNLEDSC
jgi:hypothetical protein